MKLSLRNALGIALALSVLGAQNAGAVNNGEWGVVPADDPTTGQRTSFDYPAWPGLTVTDTVVVSNLTDRDYRFKIYAADASKDAEGAIAVLDADSQRLGVGAWVTFGTDLVDGELVIPARSASHIPFRLTVPADTKPGEYAGGIAAIRVESSPSGVIEVVNAVATVIALHVSADPPANITLTDFSTEAGGAVIPGAGTTTVKVTVRNASSSPASVTLYTETDFGGTSPVQMIEVDGNGSVEVTSEIPKTPSFGDGTVTVRATASGLSGQVTDSKTVRALPIWAFGLFGFAALGVVGLRIRRSPTRK